MKKDIREIFAEKFGDSPPAKLDKEVANEIAEQQGYKSTGVVHAAYGKWKKTVGSEAPAKTTTPVQPEIRHVKARTSSGTTVELPIVRKVNGTLWVELNE